MAQNGKDNGDKTGKEIIYVPASPYQYEPDDEISLTDILAVFFRHKLLFFGIILVALCLSAGVLWYLPHKYEATTMIEIGQLYREDEGYTNVENQNAVKNRIEAFAKSTATQMADRAESADYDLGFSIKNDFSVEVPEDGSIVISRLEVQKSPKVLGFLKEINREVLTSHNRIFEKTRSNIEYRIGKLKLNNKNIDIRIQNLKANMSEIKRNFKENTQKKENTIDKIENKIKTVKERKDYIKRRIELLQEEREDLKGMIQETEARCNKLVDLKLAANAKVKDESAVSLMLYSNEIQNLRAYLDQLRKRCFFKIPEQISDLDTQLKELDTRIRNYSNDIKLEKTRLQQLEPRMKDRIEEIKNQIQKARVAKEQNDLSIRNYQTRLKNMISTRILVEPRYSNNPVSPNKKLILALGLVLGVFAAIFLVFVWDFWQRNRDRLSGSSRDQEGQG